MGGLVRSLYSEQKSSGISIKLTGGRFSITGAPVTDIMWSVDDENKEVDLRLVADREEPIEIDEMYIQDQFNWIVN